MIDNMNPNSQFHPYLPMNEIPAVERRQAGLSSKIREYARANPAVVLGALAALAIGVGLLRRRV